ncbi:ECF transporter S component [Thermohalobacter berrensis]|uniref:Riboflavin transporter n=1 Tax=Thermohalobacter berrensis TaxID=99594 RepID=A0A419T4H8_9FIRM|nr:ECF transporter S component [Thermohalobacter berrensis]RKD32349.1 ECF transporter S component [Thermohalobacter berrensis]
MLIAKKRINTRWLVNVSILSVIAFLIMYIEIPLWFAPSFLTIDLSDLPALIGAFALGPMAGVVIEFLKNILHAVIKGTTTVGVGELANFIVGSVFVYIAGYIYYKNKTFKNAIVGLMLGTLIMTLVASVANYFILIPFYAKLYGMPIKAIIGMASKVNKYVVDLKSLVLFAIVPFNIVKGIMVSAITVLLYKKVSPIFKG